MADHANQADPERKASLTLHVAEDVEHIEAPVTWKAYLLCAFASVGGIFFGYDIGYINGVLGSRIFIDAVMGPGHKELSENYSSLIVSILSCGTFFGALVAGDLADWFGRKWTVIMGCVVYMIGVIVQMITSPDATLGPIVAGRLIAGLGVGFESAIVILYMSEIVRYTSPINFSVSEAVLTGPNVVPSQSPWCAGGRLPILHHNRHHVGFNRRIRNQRPFHYCCVPYSDCNPIYLGLCSWWRPTVPP